MSRKLLLACVVALTLLATGAATPLAALQQPAAAGRVLEETELERQTREISSQLRCVVCQGLSLQDSPSQLAQEMRAIVREKLQEGMTPAEVKAYFVASYGEWVLMQPEPKGFNLLVYIMPVAMLVGGAGFIFFQARKWTRQAPTGQAESADEEELTPHV
jgi:cytochrome c-type biogenesis protein CcmH